MNLLLLFAIITLTDKKVLHEDWARNLVHALSFDSAISPRPSPEEYFEVLSGKKRIIIKGEELLLKEEKPYIYTCKVSLPSGRFIIAGKARTTSIITIGDKSFLLKKSEKFLEKAGNILLPRGEYEIKISSYKKDPVDFIVIDSGCFTPISPLRGWMKGKELTFGDKASSIVRALNLEELLPQFPEYEEAEAKTEGDFTVLNFFVKEKGVYSVVIETGKKRKYERVWTDTCGSYSFLTGPDGKGVVWTKEMDEGKFKLYGRMGIKGYLIKRKAEEDEYMKILMRMGFLERKKEEFVSEADMEENIKRLEVRAEKKEIPPVPYSLLVLWPEIPIPFRKPVSPLLPEFAE
jgi:hypothetical protein